MGLMADKTGRGFGAIAVLLTVNLAGAPAIAAPVGGVGAVASGLRDRLAWGSYPWYSGAQPADAIAQGAVAAYLQRLRAEGIDPARQGIWIQQGDRVLASHNATVPLSAASLTKLATSLVALDRFGPGHQFTTEFWTDGAIANGAIQGNLIVRTDGDPFFVWEDAIAIANGLQSLGITRIEGNLVIEGAFAMNFLPDPQYPAATPPIRGGEMLAEAFDSRRWNRAAAAQHGTMAPGTPKPQIELRGAVELAPFRTQPLTATPPNAAAPTSAPATPATAGAGQPGEALLVRYRSLPLLELVKQVNVHSNNFMAEMLARQVGGSNAIVERLEALTGVPKREMQQINGSGLGVDNRWSPRAIAAILLKLDNYLRHPTANGAKTRLGTGDRYGLGDALLVAGRERGSLQGRPTPAGATVKTGTLNTVSALAGALPTRDRGTLWFVLINTDTPKVGTLRSEQDRFLQDLRDRWGSPTETTAIAPTRTAAGTPLTGQPLPGDRDRLDLVWRPPTAPEAPGATPNPNP
jgi:D-alanyl-D-alanine carboxypeptidase/D-alanyl-D-alanine-endopeptidase (penicillin-binding protein 4)